MLVALWIVLAAPAGRAHAAPPAPPTLDVLAVLAEFPDRALAHDRAWFSDGESGLLDRFVAYWHEVSHGRLRLRVHLGETTVRVPRPRASYVQRPHALALDALTAFRREATSEADRVALARSTELLVFFAGTGRESHVSEPPNDPWSNYVGFGSGSGGIRNASVIAEDQIEPYSPFGVLCHEFGHQLGLPELYAPGGAAHEGIGVWGLMGQGTWIERGHRPPHLSAWSKLRLGWVDAAVVETSQRRIVLPPIAREPKVIKVPMPGVAPSEYLLLENRRREGADQGLPGEGLLVWHVDESRESFRGGQSDVHHKLLHLVEADGRGDLDLGHAAGGNRGDATDPWQGQTRARRIGGTVAAIFGALALAAAVLRLGVAPSLGAVVVRVLTGVLLLWAATRLLASPVCGPRHPGMAPYDGSPGRVVIRKLRARGDDVAFDVVILPDAPPAQPADEPAGPAGPAGARAG